MVSVGELLSKLSVAGALYGAATVQDCVFGNGLTVAEIVTGACISIVGVVSAEVSVATGVVGVILAVLAMSWTGNADAVIGVMRYIFPYTNRASSTIQMLPATSFLDTKRGLKAPRLDLNIKHSQRPLLIYSYIIAHYNHKCNKIMNITNCNIV